MQFPFDSLPVISRVASLSSMCAFDLQHFSFEFFMETISSSNFLNNLLFSSSSLLVEKIPASNLSNYSSFSNLIFNISSNFLSFSSFVFKIIPCTNSLFHHIFLTVSYGLCFHWKAHLFKKILIQA